MLLREENNSVLTDSNNNGNDMPIPSYNIELMLLIEENNIVLIDSNNHGNDMPIPSYNIELMLQTATTMAMTHPYHNII